MKKLVYVSLLAVAVMNSYNSNAQQAGVKSQKMTYPKTKKAEVSDTYFGVVQDNFIAQLEDDRSADTKAWVEAENKVTQEYLSKIPYRESIKKRLEQLWNYEKYSAPFKEGDYTYFYKNNGLQNRVLVSRQKTGQQPEVFLDPNTFSKDATTSLAGIAFTKDGTLAAYQLSEGGSDWRKVVL